MSKKSKELKGDSAKRTKKPEPAPSEPSADPVTIVDVGPFTHAQCTCGWKGPGRRSRKRARADAAEHRDDGCPAQAAVGRAQSRP